MAAGADESKEQVVLELPTVRCNKRNGMLLLTSQRIAWAEELSAEYKISHHFQEIKTQKISSEQSSKVQLQLVLYDGSHVTFQFLGETNVKDRNKVKDYLLRVLDKFKPSNEIDEKVKLLNEDQNLYQMYKDLVVGGAISAEEFWANRNAALNKNDEQQTSGLPSAFLMTESDFWVTFFQSHHFHRDRSKSKKDLFSECLQKDMKELTKPMDTAELDVIQTADTAPTEGYGVKTSQQAAGDKSLGQRCNTHSAMVLRALEGPSKAKDTSASSIQRQTGINEMSSSELLPEHPATIATLHIEAQDSVSLGDTSSKPLLDLASRMQEWSYSPQMHAHEAPSIAVPSATQSTEVDTELVRHYGAVTELLRHFWACFPTRTPQLEQKLTRMADSLEHYQAVQLAAYEKTLHTNQTLHHLNSCITKALERYRLWNARRGAKR
ncbi:general transcription factor IIH subunit 1-like isoform X2 [Dysidea avara]|uniref:general transcription factor IIH subunit 1-like isoform X2 n=1 Tax=Dysidea avara TaxID=196820 RepID=UPI0033288B38